MSSSAGWLTMDEILKLTDLTYRQLMDLVERGLIATRPSGSATLYDPDDIALIVHASGRATS